MLTDEPKAAGLFCDLDGASMVLPEPGGENDQHSKDLQTSHEHQGRQYPLDHRGQNAPGHRRADFEAQGGAHIAAAAQGDGKGVGAVHASKNHDEVGGETQEDIGEEKGHECNLYRSMYRRVIHLDGQQCLGVEHVANLVAQDFQGNDTACTLESARRTPGATAKEHAQAQYDPGDVVPLCRILVEHSCRGEERHDLEQGDTDGIRDAVVVVLEQEIDDERRGHQCQHRIEAEFSILEQLLDLALEQGRVEHGKTDTREEHEHNGGIVDGGIVEVARAGIVGGKASGGRDGHRIIGGIKQVHPENEEAGRAGHSEQQIDAPQGLGGGGQPRVHLALDWARGLGGEHLYRSADKGRDNGDGKEHDSQAPDPLGE